jgi:hypothetical protein
MQSKNLKKIIKIFYFFPIFLIAGFANGQGLVTCGNTNQKPCTWQDLEELVKKVFDFALLNLAIPITIIMILYGAILMATSAGDENKFKKGRGIITSAFVGLAIVFGAWLIVTTIVKFLNIPEG